MKSETEATQAKEAVFKILHAPPSAFSFNRATWKYADLQQALETTGVILSKRETNTSESGMDTFASIRGERETRFGVTSGEWQLFRRAVTTRTRDTDSGPKAQKLSGPGRPQAELPLSRYLSAVSGRLDASPLSCDPSLTTPVAENCPLIRPGTCIRARNLFAYGLWASLATILRTEKSGSASSQPGANWPPLLAGSIGPRPAWGLPLAGLRTSGLL